MVDIGQILGPSVGYITPVFNALVKTWIEPKMAKMREDGELDSHLYEYLTGDKINNYFALAYERQAIVRSLVFQDKHMLLDDLYIPLTLKSQLEQEVIVIDKFNDQIRDCSRLLLIDLAGMGKSTILRYLFLCCIRENKGIPIFIDLRNLNSDTTLFDIICTELSLIDETILSGVVLSLLKQGDFVLFLDGYDEIPYAVRDEVTRHIQDFITKAPNNNYILSSRPDDVLATFAEFRRFHIAPLTTEEAYFLLRKYDQNAGLAEQIIEKLEDSQYESVYEFLTNPLLVSLLYKAYQYENNIPLKKHLFYRQVYDALFYTHDLTKPGSYTREKHSHISEDDFHTLLRTFGYQTIKTGKVIYGRDEILDNISKAKESVTSISVKETDFLLDLTTTVPLFVKEGEYYRWNHKSIQEYFAAQYICRDAKAAQSEVLRRMASDELVDRFANVLDLCYDIDYNAFRNTVEYDTAKAIVKFWDETFVSIEKSLVPENEIDKRRSLYLQTPMFIFPSNFFKYTIPSDIVEGEEWEPSLDETATQILAYLKANADYVQSKIMNWRPAGSDQSSELSLERFDDGTVIVFFWQQRPLRVLSLLFVKGSVLFSRKAQPEWRDEWLWSNMRREAINAICSDANPFFLNDNPALLANRPDYFAYVTNWFDRRYHPLDIAACRQLIKTVERATSQEAHNDILSGLE